jgi:hypothetical protein
MKEMSFGD